MMSGSKESSVVKKDRCPQCYGRGRDRTGDNLAVYDDGHSYCFSCHYFRPADSRKAAVNALKQRFHDKSSEMSTPQEKKTFIKLPDDVTNSLDARAGMWLGKYEITKEEVLKDGLLWSNSLEALVFPFYENTHASGVQLLGYQARSFREGTSKYTMQGPRENIMWYHSLDKAKSHGIIVVEDCVSAMKVGRYGCTLPLLGSNMSIRKQIDLYKKGDRLYFWLDYDKANESYKLAERCALAGYDTSVIVTEEDPKCYDDSEIKEILQGAGY